ITGNAPFTWAPGAHTVDAVFTDTTGSFGSAAAATFHQTANAGTVAIGASSNPAVTPTPPIFGNPGTINAPPAPPVPPVTPAAVNPTGNVTFTLDAGGPARTFTTSIATPSWTIPYNLLPVGVHHVFISYNGDGNYSASVTPFDFALPMQKNTTVISFT